jgi:hypothetical protein
VRARSYDFDGLLDLSSIRDAASKRASFRQAVASLARSGAFDGPSPLDGIAPAVLAEGVRAALDSGFFDDLDWLSPASAGVALYELGAALPPGNEKRELGRRVLSRLNEGTAEVFAAIATRMALGTRKGLGGGPLRARIGLLFAATPGAVDAGPLAYALVSRRELAREWIAQPSTGSLPARRLASRILERAAVVAARRASAGDDFAPRVFATEAVASPFARLLADREPLVWRHAAVARGLLAGVSSSAWKQTTEGLAPRLTPTEWRRAAVSLAAAIATAPERALARAKDLVRSPLAGQDKGLVATMVWGLPVALDAEPEAAEQLLDAIVDADASGAAEGIAAIARDVAGEAGRRAVATARAVLADRIAGQVDDEIERMVLRALAEELSPQRSGDASVRDAVATALQAFVDTGARDAHTAAIEALESAAVALSTLEGLGSPGARNVPALALRTTVLLLRDLDAGLLESSTLADLLHLAPRDARRGGEDEQARLDELFDRLGGWLLEHEKRPSSSRPGEIGMSGRRLRALLHLVDAEAVPVDEGDDAPRAARVRARRVETVRSLLERLGHDRRSPLHRTLCATLARALDALVREGACEAVEAMLVVASRIEEGPDLATLSEASMSPDVSAMLASWARFTRASAQEEPLPLVHERSTPAPIEAPPDSASIDDRPQTSSKVEPLFELAAALGDDGSGRAEGVRAVLLRIARALQSICNAPARKALLDAATVGIDALAGAVHAYSQLETIATRRLFGDDDATPTSTINVSAAGRLATMLARIADPVQLNAANAIAESIVEVRRLTPPALAKLVGDVLYQALELPLSPKDVEVPSVSALAVADELPAWLGPRRTIGGFYIVRPLGAGAAASVFVAKRTEDRHDVDAELFALKTPDYSGAAARSLSEREFLAIFRDEASALLGLPHSPNLARFVTFDLGAKPKPILVMELIQGPTLERFVAAAGAPPSAGPVASCGRAFEILDGVLAGLEVMHGHHIAHLDVKPSNVILREGRTPALVDFGLAGRQIRPGCATGPYGAPEIWGIVPDDVHGSLSPLPADIYAFGALAFEVLTGHTLFDADSETAIISKHLMHDGDPPPLAVLANYRPLVELLQHCLRRDPRQRWTATQLRAGLRAVASVMKDFSWPLAQ